MRTSRVISLAAGVALLAACGSDSTGPTNNAAPTADFTFACNDLSCTFTDHSSDTDGTISSRQWDFGDGQTDTGPTAQHVYASAGTYNVTVKATDNGGKSTTSAVKAVTVTAPAAGGPTAAFSVTCVSLNCAITNTSTAPGAVVTWAWDFGDGQTSTAQNPPPVHYNVTTLTTYTITLVVTSDGLTSQATRQVTPTPPAQLTCNGVACTLGLDQASTVIVTLSSSSCQAHGNTFVITAPAVDTLFTDGCFAPVSPNPGSSFPLNNGAAYTAGTQLDAEVLTGVAGATDAQLRVTGSFPTWTLEFDDGFVGPGEPDFNDLVITVQATPVP